MATQCYAMVRGSAVRVTGLKRCGSLPETVRYATSTSVASVQINEVSEASKNEVLRDDRDDARLHFVSPAQTIRFRSDVNFVRVDPGVLNLVSGVPVVTNAAGDVVGFDARTRLPAAAFALEVWSKLDPTSSVQVTGEGFGVFGFGEGPFGDGLFDADGVSGCAPRYGYTLFPFLKGGVLSGFRFENGLVSFSLRGAQTRKGSKWGYGPYDLEAERQRLYSPVSRNLSWRTFVTAGAPPEQVNGIVELVDAIDNGTASDPHPLGAGTVDNQTALDPGTGTIDGGTA